MSEWALSAFCAWDIEPLLNARPEQKLSSITVSARDVGRHLAAVSIHAQTLRRGSDAICCWGLAPLWEGLAEVWFFIGDRHSPAEFLRIFRVARKELAAEVGMARFRRLQASVPAKLPSLGRLLEHLGFVPERSLWAYGPDGSDFIGYAMILGRENK